MPKVSDIYEVLVFTTPSKYNSFMVPNNCQEFVYRIYVNASHRLDYAKSLWNKIVEDI